MSRAEGLPFAVATRVKKRAGQFDKLVDWAVSIPFRELSECRDTENYS